MPSAYEGTDIISYLSEAKIYHACVASISYRREAIYHCKLLRYNLAMQENKLVDLSFEFAKIIVNLVDNIKTPKSPICSTSLQEPAHLSAQIFMRRSAQ